MKTLSTFCPILFFVIAHSSARRYLPLQWPFPTQDYNTWYRNVGDNPGEPLYVTPYIEKGDIQTAQKLALVNLPSVNITSYSGFITVDPKYNSNLFFWYFPSENNRNTDPLLLWLQGGPGASSLFGLFVENGPFIVTESLEVKLRDYRWTKKFSMLYIDNPVGTGFSFTNNDTGYSTTESEVAENLYSALSQFFQLFPNLQNVDFYATGESYAGKYVPALAYLAYKQPPPRPFALRGIAIGDGWSDPEVMITAYPDLMFNLGLLEEKQRDNMQQRVKEIVKAIQSQQFVEASNLIDNAYSYFGDASGGVNLYNYLDDSDHSYMQYYVKYIQQAVIRNCMHVGNLTYQGGDITADKLKADVMQTIKSKLAAVMNSHKVMLYSGQLDIIVGAPLTEAMLFKLKWSNSDEYRFLNRTVWRVNPTDTQVAGYVRRVHDFYQVIVRGGGHLLPTDQPQRTLDMMDRFVFDKPFN